MLKLDKKGDIFISSVLHFLANANLSRILRTEYMLSLFFFH